MKTVMAHKFSEVPNVTIPRSQFNRSHGHKTTFSADRLYPLYVDEALPGDSFNMKSSGFVRLNTPIVPIMDNMYIDTFFFAVPIRLVWDNFQKFMGEQINPGDSIDYTVPTITGTVGVGDLYDYMGIPTGLSLTWGNLFGRAYNLIFNEWFRDQNLVTSQQVDKDDGPDDLADYTTPARRGKRHDYFTSALPWPQKGDAVSIPLGTSAPVTGIGAPTVVYPVVPTSVYETDGSGTVTYQSGKATSGTGTNDALIFEQDPNNPGFPNIRADLTNAAAATINSLRQAFQIQKLLERDARGGTRYIEIIHSHFGVTSPDSRLQRPEYLGGGSTPITITPIAQTSSTDATTPQANLSAIGTGYFDGHGFVKSFTEHCLIIGIVNVRADLTYSQGINRMFNRSTRYDFYWPSLAHIGEQAVLNKELWADGTADDDEAFGFQERYAEYRYKPSLITGLMRPDATDNLAIWHLSEDFSTRPELNATFIRSRTPISRVVATTTQPDFKGDFFFDLKCARPMPLYGVPGLIDHF